jgi:formamidopyrimidine-DNA glycosylase
MPELPEVETVVRDLRPHLVGRYFSSVRRSDAALRRPWNVAWQQALTWARVEAVRRRGKWIILDLSGGWHLLLHLGMSGRLTVEDASQRQATHTHVVFGLEEGQKLSPAPGKSTRELRFRDPRRFGSVTLFESTSRLEDFFRTRGLGPEPFALEGRLWRKRLAETRRSLKATLLDQRVVVGVGNIYADEALFEAKLHPTRLSQSLTAAEARRLREAIVAVLNRAIERRGSTIRDYVGGSGQRGGFQEEFRVYGRTGKPCPRCCTPVERLRLAGRSTHFCPKCQPAAGRKRRSKQPIAGSR